jgi:hypothetical protein
MLCELSHTMAGYVHESTILYVHDSRTLTLLCLCHRCTATVAATVVQQVVEHMKIRIRAPNVESETPLAFLHRLQQVSYYLYYSI